MMQNSEEQASLARQLLSGALQGVLSTQSREHAGYPFGSVVPYVLDQEGLPLLLLSHLSQHTRNVDADPRCGLTLLDQGDGNVQERSRLSAIGDVTPLAETADAERYFAYFPQSEFYFRQLGFRFYRFAPQRFHWNGGFATARWFSVDRIVRANPLGREAQARIVAHMNQDHSDLLRHYLADCERPDPGAAAVMVGIDAEGIDLRVQDRLFRVTLPHAIGSAQEAREVLVEMAGG
jgi:putative heme iron utilization protein